MKKIFKSNNNLRNASQRVGLQNATRKSLLSAKLESPLELNVSDQLKLHSLLSIKI
jgi:Ca2+-dependent lipid-binding protein